MRCGRSHTEVLQLPSISVTIEAVVDAAAAAPVDEAAIAIVEEPIFILSMITLDACRLEGFKFLQLFRDEAKK